MGLENFVEPAFIALGFTIGTLANTRGLSLTRIQWREPAQPPTPGAPPRTLPFLGVQLAVPDTSRFRRTVTSRLLWHFPFLLEIWYWNLAYWTYQGARAFSATHLSPSAPATALEHAKQILALEHILHLDIEHDIQTWWLEQKRSPFYMLIMRNIYYSHIVLGVCFLGYIYTFRADVFRRVRRTMALSNIIAFFIMTVYRVCPPRLLPEEYGFTDVLHGGQHSAWTKNRFQLVYAAMPSLHFGNAFLVGCVLYTYAPHRLIRLLAPIWPAAMLTTIVATANHYLADAFIGMCIPLIAWRFNTVMLNLRPLEEWVMYLTRTERPLPRDRRVDDGHGYEAIKDEENQYPDERMD